MRLILVLFCLLLALGLTTASPCRNGGRYIRGGTHRHQCLCRTGYYGLRCQYYCDESFAVFIARQWASMCSVKKVRESCRLSCALCTGPTCKDLYKRRCMRRVTVSVVRAKRSFCKTATKTCRKECY
ncbi:uncharacterized protein LOC121389629 [Gigantopelta aegis]|uniref:uncharacterized protein LOC121389629 n=1 Tax=Gigantopelta aegis TaxID=1735272 RepID=UPI001B88A9E9|nr:uncharacterized protein LOC121389629 [Gigantopelta aegis]